MEKKTILVLLLAIPSIAINVVQYNSLQRQESVLKLYSAKDRLVSSSFEDMTWQFLNKQSQEVAHNQERIEGMIVALNDMKPKDTEISGVWHDGYYRGLNQSSNQEKFAYELGYNQASKDNNKAVNESILKQHISAIYKTEIVERTSKVSEQK